MKLANGMNVEVEPQDVGKMDVFFFLFDEQICWGMVRRIQVGEWRLTSCTSTEIRCPMTRATSGELIQAWADELQRILDPSFQDV